VNAHDFEFQGIDGDSIKLAQFGGKAVLVVNTASECGYTPQYEHMERLWNEWRDKNLIVLGVPSNDFGAQEPGNENEIKEFCTSRYGVSFPLTVKHIVIGPDAHPFYRWIVDEVGEVAAPKWNFHKYLIGPHGELAGIWPSDVLPNDNEIIDTVTDTLDC
jgi:glutathione peroxidase